MLLQLLLLRQIHHANRSLCSHWSMTRLLRRFLELLLLSRRLKLQLIYILGALLQQVHQVGLVLVQRHSLLVNLLQLKRRVLFILQVNLLLLLSFCSLLGQTSQLQIGHGGVPPLVVVVAFVAHLELVVDLAWRVLFVAAAVLVDALIVTLVE